MARKSLLLGKRNQVTLPREYVPEGATHFQCEVRENGNIVLIPQVSVPASQSYFWTKRWQNGEERASRDIRSGRTRAHASSEKLFTHLDRKRKK